jgi:hypothetical protein
MHQMHISTTQVSSVMLKSKKLEIRKKEEVKTERAVGWKPNRVSWNWAKSVEGYSYAWGRWSFVLRCIYKIYFLDSSIHILKQVAKYLVTGL